MFNPITVIICLYMIKILINFVAFRMSYELLFCREITKTDTRNNYHNFLDSVEEMEKIQKRLRPYIPELWRNHKIVGLNER